MFVKNFMELIMVNLSFAVGESVVKLFEPLQSRYNEIIKDKAYLDRIIKNNAKKANYITIRLLEKLKKRWVSHQ